MAISVQTTTESKTFWLKEDVIGLCSREVYGLTNDEVKVLDDTRELWLVQGRGKKFFIRPNKLTNVRIEDPIIDKKPSGTERLVRNKVATNVNKRNTRPPLPKTGQGSLY